MRNNLALFVMTFIVIANASSDAGAHPQFMKALKAKYKFKTVSCYTCHAKSIVPGVARPKSFRNDFGKLFEPLLRDKKIEQRVKQVKAAKDAEMPALAEQLNDGVTTDFLKALATVEAMNNEASGKTYAELLKAGEIEGVKLP